jgi:hypothetical protein
MIEEYSSTFRRVCVCVCVCVWEQNYRKLKEIIQIMEKAKERKLLTIET